jgi:hypothetical protein
MNITFVKKKPLVKEIIGQLGHIGNLVRNQNESVQIELFKITN